MLDQALERVDVSGLDVDRRLVEDSPGEALVAAADGDLLVVGSHGHGAIGARCSGRSAVTRRNTRPARS